MDFNLAVWGVLNSTHPTLFSACANTRVEFVIDRYAIGNHVSIIILLMDCLGKSAEYINQPRTQANIMDACKVMRKHESGNSNY